MHDGINRINLHDPLDLKAKLPEIKNFIFIPFNLIKRVKKPHIKLNEHREIGIQHRFAKSCANNPIISSILRAGKCVLQQAGKRSAPGKPIIFLSVEIWGSYSFHPQYRIITGQGDTGYRARGVLHSHIQAHAQTHTERGRHTHSCLLMPAKQCWFKIQDSRTEYTCSIYGGNNPVLSKLNIDSYVTYVCPPH